jgi:cytochrome P450
VRISAPSEPLDVELEKVNLFDPMLYGLGDPHPIWKALRDRAPVWWQQLDDGRGFWAVSTHEDACWVLRDHTAFTSQKGTLLCILGALDPAGGRMMAVTDPPKHTQMREPLTRALSPKMIRPRRPEIERIVRHLLAPLAEGEPWDLAAAVAGFPMAFTGVLMGVPRADWPRLTRLTTMAIANDDPEFQEGSSRSTLIGAHHELFEYFSKQVRIRRAAPRDDLIGLLMRMEVEGRPMQLDGIVYNCYSLLLGANVTTPHVVAATVLAMIEHPEVYRHWTGHPELLVTGVEEGLRWASPANHFMRYAVKDVTVRGVRIREGEALAVFLGSANRDEEVFDDPYRFDLARRPNRHIAFGFGHHFCVGGPLARIALQILFSEILRLVERFELAGPVEHLTSNFVAGIKHMPVKARLCPGAERELAGSIG